MWDLLILDPMVNLLLWFYGILWDNYVLAILLLTIIIRLLLFPLTWKQQKSQVAMQELQPRLKKLQEKHKNDPEQLQQKTMELYREAGVNPLGGCLPTLIQFPILIGFYRAITRSLAASPIQLLDLSQHVYTNTPTWLPAPADLIPLNSHFAWLDLAKPDPLYILPILVVVTTWLQQKLLTPPSTGGAENQAAAMSRSMQLTMPLFIGYISLTLPSGLSVYWVVSNIIGLIQYMAMGKSSFKNLFGTEDGSFSLRGLIGLPQPPAEEKGRKRS